MFTYLVIHSIIYFKKISCFCKETYHWSLRKVGLSLEGFWRGIWKGKDCLWMGRFKKRKKEKEEGARIGVLVGKFWWDRLEEKAQRNWKREQLQPRLPRYASRHSWNHYPYSFFPCICFWIFNIPLIGVDEKGHKLICWDWLFTCLPCFGFWFSYVSLMSSEIHWLHAWIWSCSFFV